MYDARTGVVVSVFAVACVHANNHACKQLCMRTNHPFQTTRRILPISPKSPPIPPHTTPQNNTGIFDFSLMAIAACVFAFDLDEATWDGISLGIGKRPFFTCLCVCVYIYTYVYERASIPPTQPTDACIYIHPPPTSGLALTLIGLGLVMWLWRRQQGGGQMRGWQRVGDEGGLMAATPMVAVEFGNSHNGSSAPSLHRQQQQQQQQQVRVSACSCRRLVVGDILLILRRPAHTTHGSPRRRRRARGASPGRIRAWRGTASRRRRQWCSGDGG